MKRIISNIIFATVIAFGLVSCTKTDKNMEAIAGEWHWQGTEGGVEIDIWIGFNEDGTFELYQQIPGLADDDQGRYRRYDGTFTFDGTLLNGRYSDGTYWKHSYSVTVSGDRLKMDYVGEDYSLTYEKKAIPFNVRKYSTAPLKSMTEEPVPFL